MVSNAYRRSIAVAWILLVALAGSALGVRFSKSTGDELYDDSEGNTLPYRLFPPDDYCGDVSPLFRPEGCDPDKPYPLILYFHGAGERGVDNRLQCSGGGHMENLYQAALGETFEGQHQAFLLAPQCPTTDQWVDRNWTLGTYTQAEEPPISRSMQSALEILDHVIATYPIDPKRIYVTGLSMGGYATWDVLSRRPRQFAAAIPLSGGGNRDLGEALKNVPVWAYHGSTDSVVPVEGTDGMQTAINEAGGFMEYTRIAVGHEGWSSFYDNITYTNSAGQTIYEWLFAQTLGQSSNPDYEGWSITYPDLDLASPEADSDGDGLTNLEEYLFGLDPTRSDSALPIKISSHREHLRSVVYTRRDPSLSGATYTVLGSLDLVDWHETSQIETSIIETGQLQTITLTFNDPRYRFLRIEAK